MEHIPHFVLSSDQTSDDRIVATATTADGMHVVVAYKVCS